MTHVLLLDLSLKERVSDTDARNSTESTVAYLLLRRKVVYNIEELANLFRCLALDHVRHGFATNISVEAMLDQLKVPSTGLENLLQ